MTVKSRTYCQGRRKDDVQCSSVASVGKLCSYHSRLALADADLCQSCRRLLEDLGVTVPAGTEPT